MGPKQHLKYKGIAPKTARCYKKEIHRFFLFLEAEGEPLPSHVSRLDFLLGEFTNTLYQEGDSLTQAGWLLSGFKRFMPQIKYQIPTAQQYYNNWLRDHVPLRAIPLPWVTLGAIASVAWRSNHRDLAVLLLLGFSFFLRTMEFVTLRREDIVFDRRSGRVVVTLHKTKTSRQFQQSLVLHHPALVNILATAMPSLPTSGQIWRGSAASFRRCFHLLLSELQLGDVGFSLYSIRRGGATHLYAATRDLNYVTLQGRWKDFRTARIYLDDARATLLKLSFPPPVSHHLLQLARFWSTFR